LQQITVQRIRGRVRFAFTDYELTALKRRFVARVGQSALTCRFDNAGKL